MNKRIVSEKVIKGRPADSPDYRNRIYDLVKRIPKGRVMSYGLIARILGVGYDARAIGNAMFATPKDTGEDIPWHRVINAQGGCSTAGRTLPPNLQQLLLEEEGVAFNDKAKCKIDNYIWYPPEYKDEELKQTMKNLFD